MAKVESGDLDPLKLKIQLKWIEKLIDAIDTPIKDLVKSEASKYGKSFELLGFKVEEIEAGVKYSYENCGDEKWKTLDRLEKSIKEEKAGRELFLKSLKESITVVDEETGETYKVFPPQKKSTSTLRFTAI